MIGEAYLAACLAELDALKPGNVHRHAPGHGMTVEDFQASARASAPEIARPGARVGARILAATLATRAAVGQNTNLGILLLCAPLAAAAEAGGLSRESLARVLAGLDIADARAAFCAIAAANPGGLGSVERHDVRDPPAVTLREAMLAAAGRDCVARQYASGFADVFGLGARAHAEARARGGDPAEAVYLAFLSRLPDTHIARKLGLATAEAVRRDAAARLAGLNAQPPAARARALAAWDRALKARGLNPGTSADLTVATLFAAFLRRPRHEWLAAAAQQ